MIGKVSVKSQKPKKKKKKKKNQKPADIWCIKIICLRRVQIWRGKDTARDLLFWNLKQEENFIVIRLVDPTNLDQCLMQFKNKIKSKYALK